MISIKNQFMFLLNYFDLKLNTEAFCDAFPYGLSAILTQYCENENKKRVAYASRSLTETEQRYSQTETEALAMLFGCAKFQVYLLRKILTY